MRKNIRARFRQLSLSLLAMPAVSSGESVCIKESAVADHFESIETGYAFVSDEKVRLDVYLWSTNRKLTAEVVVYYGVADSVDSTAGLDGEFELKVEVAAFRDEDDMSAALLLDREFSRLLIEVNSSYHEGGIPTCGYSHVLAVSRDDLSENQRFGKLGPMTLVK